VDLPFLVFVAAAAAVWSIQAVMNRLARPPAAWFDAFRQANIELSATPGPGRHLEGTRDPLRVSVARESSGGTWTTVVRILGPFDQLSATSRFQYGAEVRPVLTGDPEVDRSVLLYGDERVIRALCDPATRRALRSVIDMGVKIENSQVVWHCTWDLELKRRLAQLVDFSERLVPPRDLAQRIADNIVHESLASVRALNVATLVKHFEPWATRSAVLAALNDLSEKVRLEAAIALGEEGHRCLLVIALSQVAEQADVLRAIAQLGDGFTPRHARWALRRAMSSQRLTTVKVCLEQLVRADDARSVSAVRAALSSERDAVALAASRALKDGATTQFEGTLIEALTHRLVDVQRDAVVTLGRVGTVESVAPLVDWVAHHALDRFVRADAPRAIAAIQSRLPGASPGQLSIAGAEAGQVSLAAEDQRGAVSLEEPGSG